MFVSPKTNFSSWKITMPLYNSSEVFVPAKQYGNTIHSDSLDIKKTERDALLCLCLLLITSSSEVSLFKRFISMHNN